MWGNPRPTYTRCARDRRPGVFRPDTDVTRKNTASQESHDTPRRRATDSFMTGPTALQEGELEYRLREGPGLPELVVRCGADGERQASIGTADVYRTPARSGRATTVVRDGPLWSGRPDSRA